MNAGLKLPLHDRCGQAGLKQVGALGLQPQASSGNYQRKMDAFLRKRADPEDSESPGYVVPIPAFHRASGERAIHDMVCWPPHEGSVAGILSTDLQAAMQRWEAPPKVQPASSGQSDAGARETCGPNRNLPKCRRVCDQRQHAGGQHDQLAYKSQTCALRVEETPDVRNKSRLWMPSLV